MTASTQKDAVTKLCNAIRAELGYWGQQTRLYDAIVPDMSCLTLAEWVHILDRLEIR